MALVGWPAHRREIIPNDPRDLKPQRCTLQHDWWWSEPPRNMLDWLTWPADQLLRIGGIVAGWFFSRDATSFTVVQMMFATLVLAAFVTMIVCWQKLFEYCRSFWKPADRVR